MLFGKNDENVRDMVIYKTKPNMFLGCKKAIFGVVLLLVILMVSPMVIKFIGEMQVYLISYVKLSLTRYAAIAFFVIILIDVIYIIWQLMGWYSLEYTLTDSKIIIKSGVLSTKKNYMPYATIQDVNTSQSLLARLINVGSVSVFSAYDNNQVELKNISNPSEVEEIIFSKMVGPRNFQVPPQRFPIQSQGNDFNHREDFLGRNDYYDEYEPITPITHENTQYPRREYEYYSEEVDNTASQRHSYEYEPYTGSYNNSPNTHSEDSYYNQIRDKYSYVDEDYYQNNDSELYYNDGVDQFDQSESNDVDESSQNAIERHFDKFKK